MGTDNVPALPADVSERVARLRREMGALEPDRLRYAVGKLPERWRGHPEVMAAEGRARCLLGEIDLGAGLIERAFRAAPGVEQLVCDYAGVLFSKDQPGEGKRLLEAAHAAHPEWADVVGLLRQAAEMEKDFPLAAAYANKLIALRPRSVEGLRALGLRKQSLRQYEDSIGLLTRCLEEEPGNLAFAGGLLMTMLYHGSDPARVREVSERFTAAAFGGVRPKGAAGPRSARLEGRERLRIGYFGDTFVEHVVLRFMQGVFREHDRSRFWVGFYSTTRNHDASTQIVRASADVFRELWGMSDDEVALAIRRDEVDVLIDLHGLSRLGVIARRPAPLQMTYMAYPATTGLAAFDYRITDALADPEGETDGFHTERLHRLGRCGWAYEVSPADTLHDLPETLEVRKGGPLVFGSFNVMTKVSQATTALWGRMLGRTRRWGTTLVLTDRAGLTDDREAAETLKGELMAAGAGAEQVEMSPFQKDRVAHRRRYAGVDVMLDPLSYNGTTTTCEALWHGVPTLTLPGRAHVSRVGVSLNTAVGLTEFIARDEEDFIARAERMAADPAGVRAMRPGHRERLRKSELGDARSLAREIERACVELSDRKLKMG